MEDMSKIIKTARPVIFNENMVRATLENRKIRLSRLIYLDPADIGEELGPEFVRTMYDPEYQIEDYLYIKERWQPNIWDTGYLYEASFEQDKALFSHYADYSIEPWKTARSMPREAARIIFRVSDVDAEQLNDMTDKQIADEGYLSREHYMRDWDNRLKKADRELYGTSANPWYYAYTLERIK